MEYLVVDGYNVIGSWPELRQLRDSALAEARDRLVEMLQEYRAFSDVHIILVFDAYKTREQQHIETLKGMEIYYTEHGQTADALIESLVTGLAALHPVGVVTSDGAQQQIVLGKGARRWSSREFHLEYKRAMAQIAGSVRHTKSDRRTTRFEDRLNQNTKINMEKIVRNGDKP